MKWIEAKDAKKQILAGHGTPGMHVKGHLNFRANETLHTLPPNLTVKRLTLDSVPHLKALPDGLNCYELSAEATHLSTVPSDLAVEYRLNLSNCTELITLPTGLNVGSLLLSGCTALKNLPEGLTVYFLDISGCTQLIKLPDQATVQVGRLVARGCTHLRTLPGWLTNLAQLDVSDCTALTELPEGLHVSSWVDLANTPIQALPASMQGTRLRWHGLMVSERIVFHPETITVQEILDEPNAELRRVLLERKGNEAFVKEAQAEVLDHDQDAGGVRRLLRVHMPNDESLVGLEVRDPSTTRQYFLRVPPTMATCRQAAAWIAGFDNPDDYNPLVET